MIRKVWRTGGVFVVTVPKDIRLLHNINAGSYLDVTFTLVKRGENGTEKLESEKIVKRSVPDHVNDLEINFVGGMNENE